MLTLAFDTATDIATVALVRDGEVLGERRSRAARVLADVEEILAEAGLTPRRARGHRGRNRARGGTPGSAWGS